MTGEHSTYRVHKSLGLIWAVEEFEDGDSETHGPFMDLADAFDQCDRPDDWRVEFGG